MHNCVLIDAKDKPLTPVFTWLDRRGEAGMDYVRNQLGDTYHERTGCRYHPMFPVFKLATLRLSGSALLAQTARVVSIKTFLTHALTGVWMEDHGMASSSGLFNIRANEWDLKLLEILELDRGVLPPVSSRTHILGTVTRAAAAQFGLPEGVAVVNGSGDGFFAHLGSDCEIPEKMSVSLGTSAAARQSLAEPILQQSAGTFCYKADDGAYLLGCAGNNGGNVLNWGRSIFGELRVEPPSNDVPIFIPLLHGERSPEWNQRLSGAWHGLRAQHTSADLSRSILEGVAFNLAYFVEILRAVSRVPATTIVLSGNGFLQPLAASVLASAVDVPVWMPHDPGLATLRGGAVCALRALGKAIPAFDVKKVSPLMDTQVRARFRRYVELRTGRTYFGI
ncbi:MAG: hypothetical protein HY646_17235 [Acidobacteria bacterium]|nr:hypothetical protein [Acidobacteriota bacterium]